MRLRSVIRTLPRYIDPLRGSTEAASNLKLEVQVSRHPRSVGRLVRPLLV